MQIRYQNNRFIIMINTATSTTQLIVIKFFTIFIKNYIKCFTIFANEDHRHLTLLQSPSSPLKWAGHGQIYSSCPIFLCHRAQTIVIMALLYHLLELVTGDGQYFRQYRYTPPSLDKEICNSWYFTRNMTNSQWR